MVGVATGIPSIGARSAFQEVTLRQGHLGFHHAGTAEMLLPDTTAGAARQSLGTGAGGSFTNASGPGAARGVSTCCEPLAASGVDM